MGSQRLAICLGITAASLAGCGRSPSAHGDTTRAATDQSAATAAPSRADSSADVARDSAVTTSRPGAGGIELYAASDLARITRELAGASSSGRTIGGHPTFHYVESRRVRDGSPEIHDDWVDVTVVQAGRATLLTGGSVSGGSLTGAGEHRGGRITSGSPQPIAAGDLFVVPAGVPHQFRVAPGDSVVYLTIKIKR